MRGRLAVAALTIAVAARAGALPARADADEALADFKAGRYMEAVAEIQAVLDRSPGYAYGHFLLGHCMLKMRRVGEAEREFLRALSFDSTRAEYFQGLGLAFNASGNWPWTVRAATEGLVRARDPRTRFELLAMRGHAWTVLRQWNAAAGDFETAQRIRPEPWVLVFLGRARFAAGDYLGAIDPLRQSLLTAPDEPVVLRLLAECHLRLAADEADPNRKRFDYTQSWAYAQRLASAAPGNLDAVQLVARAALGAGKLDQAETLFRHVIAIDPRQCYALADLGRTFLASGRWTEAETYLRKASMCAPRMGAVYESLGQLYLRTGKPQEAAVEFRRVDEIEPRRPSSDDPGTVPVFAPR